MIWKPEIGKRVRVRVGRVRLGADGWRLGYIVGCDTDPRDSSRLWRVRFDTQKNSDPPWGVPEADLEAP